MKKPATRRPMTVRHHEFVAGKLAGKSDRQAAIDAGFTAASASSRALELNAREDVQALIAGGKKRLMKATDYTAEAAFDDLDKAMDFAVKANSPGAYVKAIEAKARMVGILDKPNALLVISVDEALRQARSRMLIPRVEDAQVRAPLAYIPSDRDVDIYS
jgi:hypothetical protein